MLCMVGSGNGASKWAEMLISHVWGGPVVGTTCTKRVFGPLSHHLNPRSPLCAHTKMKGSQICIHVYPLNGTVLACSKEMRLCHSARRPAGHRITLADRTCPHAWTCRSSCDHSPDAYSWEILSFPGCSTSLYAPLTLCKSYPRIFCVPPGRGEVRIGRSKIWACISCCVFSFLCVFPPCRLPLVFGLNLSAIQKTSLSLYWNSAMTTTTVVWLTWAVTGSPWTLHCQSRGLSHLISGTLCLLALMIWVQLLSWIWEKTRSSQRSPPHLQAQYAGISVDLPADCWYAVMS